MNPLRVAIVFLLLTSAASVFCGCGETIAESFDQQGLHASDAEYFFMLVERTPAEPTKGINHMRIELTDERGEPVVGAVLTVEPWMPAHGHGTTVVGAQELADGIYEVDDLYFNMGGHWEVRLHMSAGEQQDRAMLPYQVH